MTYVVSWGDVTRIEPVMDLVISATVPGTPVRPCQAVRGWNRRADWTLKGAAPFHMASLRRRALVEVRNR
jgi:hypothetical protein